MRQWLVWAGCVVILSGFFGCQNADNRADLNNNKGVDVLIEGGRKFPRSLVGTWKADEGGWEFVFERDGTISSAVIDDGLVRVTPAWKVSELKLAEGSKGTYKLGQWTVQYSPNNRELAVQVVVEHYRLETKSFAMEGQRTDWFVGPVSKDSRSWETEWFNIQKVTAFAPGEENLVFERDPNNNPVGILVFSKQPAAN
jgi:hypothetical protein